MPPEDSSVATPLWTSHRRALLCDWLQSCVTQLSGGTSEGVRLAAITELLSVVLLELGSTPVVLVADAINKFNAEHIRAKGAMNYQHYLLSGLVHSLRSIEAIDGFNSTRVRRRAYFDGQLAVRRVTGSSTSQPPPISNE